MGTVFQIPWTYVSAEDWPTLTLSTLRTLGFATAALALREDSLSLGDPLLYKEKNWLCFWGRKATDSKTKP